MKNIHVSALRMAVLVCAAKPTGNVCKYCLEPIPVGYFCCRRCWKANEED